MLLAGCDHADWLQEVLSDPQKLKQLLQQHPNLAAILKSQAANLQPKA